LVCDYCGCQDLDAIAELTAEHDVVVTLSGQVRRALRDGDLDLAADGIRAVVAVLGLHTAVEEGALFPAALATLSAAQWDRVDAARSRPSPIRR
jgi:hemerythrin-like domain-containing protein